MGVGLRFLQWTEAAGCENALQMPCTVSELSGGCHKLWQTVVFNKSGTLSTEVQRHNLRKDASNLKL